MRDPLGCIWLNFRVLIQSPVVRSSASLHSVGCSLSRCALAVAPGTHHAVLSPLPPAQPLASRQTLRHPQIQGDHVRLLRSWTRCIVDSRAAALVVTASVQPAAPGKRAAVSPASRELQCRSAGQAAGTGAATHGFPSLRPSGNPGAPPPALCA